MSAATRIDLDDLRALADGNGTYEDDAGTLHVAFGGASWADARALIAVVDAAILLSDRCTPTSSRYSIRSKEWYAALDGLWATLEPFVGVGE